MAIFGRRYRGPSSKYSNSQIASYLNPFSSSTDCKIPDGKSLLSKGIKHNQSFSVGFTADTVTVAVFPGLVNGIFVVGASLNGSPLNSTIPFDNSPQLNGNEWANEQINKWRLVSQGCKLSMVNNMDDNDGWFEAARCYASFDTGGNFSPSVAVSANTLLAPNVSFPYLDTTENMANAPSYMTGTLKAIGKYNFNLSPTSREHEFHRLTTVGAFVDSDAKDLGDDSHDCIVIRLHGKTAVTQLHVQHVANHEYEYHYSSSLHHTQTFSNDTPSLVRAANMKKKRFNGKAGTTARAVGLSSGRRRSSYNWGKMNRGYGRMNAKGSSY